MKPVNVDSLRQSLDEILEDLDADKEPMLVEQDGKPRAVLISLEEYQRLLVDHQAMEQRRRAADEIRAMCAVSQSGLSVVEELRRLRNGED